MRVNERAGPLASRVPVISRIMGDKGKTMETSRRSHTNICWYKVQQQINSKVKEAWVWFLLEALREHSWYSLSIISIFRWFCIQIIFLLYALICSWSGFILPSCPNHFVRLWMSSMNDVTWDFWSCHLPHPISSTNLRLLSHQCHLPRDESSLVRNLQGLGLSLTVKWGCD